MKRNVNQNSFGEHEEEKLRHNTLLSNDVAQEIKIAQEWIDALDRTNTTGIRLFGSKELGQIELRKKTYWSLIIKGKFWAGKITHQIMYSCGAV